MVNYYSCSSVVSSGNLINFTKIRNNLSSIIIDSYLNQFNLPKNYNGNQYCDAQNESTDKPPSLKNFPLKWHIFLSVLLSLRACILSHSIFLVTSVMTDA